MKDTIKEIRDAHERIGKLLGQMEAAEVPMAELQAISKQGSHADCINDAIPYGTFTADKNLDLQPYVMEIKDESQAERALAAARKLGLTIDDHKEFREYRDSKRYFITKEQGCGFYNHSGVNRTPITLKDFEKLAGIVNDPLEGKQVEGFNNNNGNGLNYGDLHLWAPKKGVWAICRDQTPIPHHLTRVTERTVGRFYLIEGQDGSQPFHFGLFLGDKYVRWANSEHAPVHVYRKIEKLTMYEVTPTV